VAVRKPAEARKQRTGDETRTRDIQLGKRSNRSTKIVESPNISSIVAPVLRLTRTSRHLMANLEITGKIAFRPREPAVLYRLVTGADPESPLSEVHQRMDHNSPKGAK
jgi:hypothetical protein